MIVEFTMNGEFKINGEFKMIGEFKKGDVVLQIGGSNAFVIDGAYETTMWYSVQYLWSNKVYHADKSKFDLDSDYVKVDFCKNPFDDKQVYAKLIRIAKAFEKYGNE